MEIEKSDLIRAGIKFNVGSMKHKKMIMNALILSLSAVLSFYLLSSVSISDFLVVAGKIQPIYIALCVVAYVMASVLRSLRFWYIMERKVGMRTIMNVVLAHNLFNQIFPMRSGEFSFVYLIKKTGGISASAGLAVLVISRFFDFVITTALLFVLLIMIGFISQQLLLSMMLLAISSLVPLALLFSLLIFRDRMLRIIENIFSRRMFQKYEIFLYILKNMSAVSISMDNLSVRKKALPIFAMSILIWVFLLATIIFLIIGFGAEISLFSAFILAFIMALLPLVPIYGLGGFGTTEAVMSVVFLAFGVSSSIAIPMSFGIHVVALMITIALGFIGIFAIGLKKIHR